MINKIFWKDKKVFITGHTGFKGSWLSLILNYLGAEITGYALAPPTEPGLFKLCQIDNFITSVISDIRDKKSLEKAVLSSEPEIVIHMAAQPIVRESYINPLETFEINVMGTVNLFEAIRECRSVKAIINITTDKCYENKEWCWGYRENEPLGGYDPYSASKACSELVTASYRKSFFTSAEVGLASARAGNVIGGGDWAKDRLIPDCIRAILKGEKIIIRNPSSIRPWQHVMEPLGGYLLLAQRLYEDNEKYSGPWNFGPDDNDAKPVEWIVKKICQKWGGNASYEIDKGENPHEANYLKLDCSKAKSCLRWYPKWNLEQAIDKVLEWTIVYKENRDLKKVCLRQIEEYMVGDNNESYRSYL